MKDYVINFKDYADTKDDTDDVPVHFALFADGDPITFEEASQDEKWKNAMQEAIEKNKTWE